MYKDADMVYDNYIKRQPTVTYAIIGDVHSQGRPLASALAHCKEHNLTPILLGDLFDSRCTVSETLCVYDLARRAEREMGAIILNSNHQERLIEATAGTLERAEYCKETFRTLEELQESDLDPGEITDWLRGLPDGFVFRDSTDHEYCCAHAYFPITLRDSSRTGPYTVFAVSDEEREKMVWGPMNSDGRRYHWWRRISDKQSFTRVAGHYHKVLINDQCLILDANAGYEEGSVLLYEVESKTPVYFDATGATIKQELSSVA